MKAILRGLAPAKLVRHRLDPYSQVMLLDKMVYDSLNCCLSLNRDANTARNIKRLGLLSVGVA